MCSTQRETAQQLWLSEMQLQLIVVGYPASVDRCGLPSCISSVFALFFHQFVKFDYLEARAHNEHYQIAWNSSVIGTFWLIWNKGNATISFEPPARSRGNHHQCKSLLFLFGIFARFDNLFPSFFVSPSW